jgi:hypothetical protein
MEYLVLDSPCFKLLPSHHGFSQLQWLFITSANPTEKYVIHVYVVLLDFSQTDIQINFRRLI